MKKIGKYEILAELGKGGMGIVYKARDPIINRTVAIKVILEAGLEAEEMKKRFYREAQTAGNLNHENITVVYDMGEENGKPYIVMEFLQGNELREIIKAKQSWTLRQKLDCTIQICSGLKKAHDNGIVHRDIKPENIFVLEDGKVKIMDFGIARQATSTLTMTGMTIGTPYYMSPEQLKGAKVDRQSDIFSFGAVFYELLTYKRPFEGSSIETVMYKILQEEPERINIEEAGFNDDLHRVLAKCLAKNTADRYQDFKDVIKDLNKVFNKIQSLGDKLIEHDFVATVPVQTGKKKPAAKRTNKALFVFAGLVIVVGVGFILFKDKFIPGSNRTAKTGTEQLGQIKPGATKTELSSLENRAEEETTQPDLKSETGKTESPASDLKKSETRQMPENTLVSKIPTPASSKPDNIKPGSDINLLIAQAKSAKEKTEAKRREVDSKEANVAALEAYSLALNLERQGSDYLKSKKYDDALSAFNKSVSTYERALFEKECIDKALLLFNKGEYQNGSGALEDVFKNAPHDKENQKARKLSEEISAALNNKNLFTQKAQQAAKAGELRAAMVFLNSLPDRDKNTIEVQTLLKQITEKDESPPVIDHTPEQDYDPAEPVFIQAIVQDNLSVREVTLHYQQKGTNTYIKVKMETQAMQKYGAFIPQDYHKGKEIRYYLTAKDGNGNEKVLGSEKQPFKIKSRQKEFVQPNIP